ncbi:hypothetical protein ACOME3_002133 [Neoechinorhynchus agilis]
MDLLGADLEILHQISLLSKSSVSCSDPEIKRTLDHDELIGVEKQEENEEEISPPGTIVVALEDHKALLTVVMIVAIVRDGAAGDPKVQCSEMVNVGLRTNMMKTQIHSWMKYTMAR